MPISVFGWSWSWSGTLIKAKQPLQPRFFTKLDRIVSGRVLAIIVEIMAQITKTCSIREAGQAQVGD